MQKHQRGFTLVELSIVLVILGLLIGGVLTGQSLIRAAELRSVSTQYSRYVTAVQTFRDKYFALPGDMMNATAYWGTDPGGCPAASNLVPKTATCNGDGNGQINFLAATTSSNEQFRMWQHLADAGLIEGQYSGTSGSGGSVYTVSPNANTPPGRISGSAWSARYLGAMPTSNGMRYGGMYANHFQIGLLSGSVWNDTGVMKPEDAYNIDMKIDDGKPSTGFVIGDWVVCTTSSDGGDYTGTYALTTTSNACWLNFFWDAPFVR